MAEELSLPLFLHNRNTGADFISAVSETSLPGVVHSFTGSEDELHQLLTMVNLQIGINGCSLKTEENCRVAAQVPCDRLLLETDAPWCDIRPTHASHCHTTALEYPVAKQPKKWVEKCCVKGRNEPAHIRMVADAMSALTHTDRDVLVQQVYANSIALFPLMQ
jgi:TatD DNase family protein